MGDLRLRLGAFTLGRQAAAVPAKPGLKELAVQAANRFDQGMRLFLLLSYVVVVLALCLITSADSDEGARSLVFPPGSLLANQ